MAIPADEIRSQYVHRAYLLQAQVDTSTWDAAEQTIRQLIPLSTRGSVNAHGSAPAGHT